MSSTQQVIVESYFKNYKLTLHQKRQHDKLLQKSFFRKRLKPAADVLGMTKEEALAAIAEKRRKKDEFSKKKA